MKGIKLLSTYLLINCWNHRPAIVESYLLTSNTSVAELPPEKTGQYQDHLQTERLRRRRSKIIGGPKQPLRSAESY